MSLSSMYALPMAGSTAISYGLLKAGKLVWETKLIALVTTEAPPLVVRLCTATSLLAVGCPFQIANQTLFEVWAWSNGAPKASAASITRIFVSLFNIPANDFSPQNRQLNLASIVCSIVPPVFRLNPPEVQLWSVVPRNL